MVAQLLNGTEIAAVIKQQLEKEIKTFKTRPNLAFITKEKSIYLNELKKRASEIGISIETVIFNKKIDETICNLNGDINTHGIVIDSELEITKEYRNYLLSLINPLKDIEGITPTNLGRIMLGNPLYIPATVSAIIAILNHYNFAVARKSVCIIGRSITIGKPLALMLTNLNATTTLCHSKTKNLRFISKNASIVIVAVGKPNFLTEEFVSPKSIVIDVGINVFENKLCGDVCISISKIVKALTPVPNGVGIVTSILLLKSLISSYKLQNNIII